MAPFVIPAKAGIQPFQALMCEVFWIPAFAGMTEWEAKGSVKPYPPEQKRTSGRRI